MGEWAMTCVVGAGRAVSLLPRGDILVEQKIAGEVKTPTTRANKRSQLYMIRPPIVGVKMMPSTIFQLLLVLVLIIFAHSHKEHPTEAHMNPHTNHLQNSSSSHHTHTHPIHHNSHPVGSLKELNNSNSNNSTVAKRTSSRPHHVIPTTARCGLTVLNNHNVGHIFGDVLPAMLDTIDPHSQCTLVFPTLTAKREFSKTPLFDIAKQLHIKLNTTTKEEFEHHGQERIDYFYHPMIGNFSHGFSRLRQIIQKHIDQRCKCPEFPNQCNRTKVTFFNREVRHYANHMQLLKRLQSLSIEWEYIETTDNSNQCWHFCHYRNTSIVFTPYGAETIYPIITNRTAIVMGYHGRKDSFLERKVTDYGFYGGDLGVVNAVPIEEDYNKNCFNRWMNPDDPDEGYLYHKCMSYYLDDKFLDSAIEMIQEFRKNDCERLALDKELAS